MSYRLKLVSPLLPLATTSSDFRSKIHRFHADHKTNLCHKIPILHYSSKDQLSSLNMKVLVQSKNLSVFLVLLLSIAGSSCQGQNLRQRNVSRVNDLNTPPVEAPATIIKTTVQQSAPSSSKLSRQLRASATTNVATFAVSAMGGVMNMNTMSGF